MNEYEKKIIDEFYKYESSHEGTMQFTGRNDIVKKKLITAFVDKMTGRDTIIQRICNSMGIREPDVNLRSIEWYCQRRRNKMELEGAMAKFNLCSEMKSPLCKTKAYGDDVMFCEYCGAPTTMGLSAEV